MKKNADVVQEAQARNPFDPPKNQSNDLSASSLSVEILQQPVPKLPHEADQSTRDQDAPVRPEIIQAADDVKAGLKDTGRAPVVNEVYKRQKT